MIHAKSNLLTALAFVILFILGCSERSSNTDTTDSNSNEEKSSIETDNDRIEKEMMNEDMINNLIGSFVVKLFLESDEASEIWEETGFQEKRSVSFCYDTVHFHELVIEGNIDSLQIDFVQQEETIWSKTISKLEGNVKFADLPFLENGKLLLSTGNKIFFEADLVGESCM
ncbi:hypothetical protein JMN32_18110 [Fulvivirga sp. 29W222]|uniref:Uncharacterized protein n=1 Tax=Fulvivirga marina TaxID=2494733 RepID=A0A937KD95_9BACT|nr:hypothetical protein [Fulvivirga marina]MBL6448234.1 hypothetical protein [Fulvivirga marina]